MNLSASKLRLRIPLLFLAELQIVELRNVKKVAFLLGQKKPFFAAVDLSKEKNQKLCIFAKLRLMLPKNLCAFDKGCGEPTF